MDYEKKYKEAYKKAEQIHCFSSDIAEIKRMEELFPELAESEGERIRKELINYFKCQSLEEPTRKETHEKWIAWLKKQGEKKSLDDIAKEVTKDKDAAISFLKSADIINEKGELAEQYRQSEQKPVWSEEDENKVTLFMQLVEGCDNSEDLSNWLKSLNDRVQPKQEWSREDKDAVNQAILALEDLYDDACPLCHYDGYKLPFDKAAKRLKSIRPQNTWKPSDVQMEALDDFIYAKYPNIEKYGAAVKSLYQDLKKLRED